MKNPSIKAMKTTTFKDNKKSRSIKQQYQEKGMNIE